MIVIKPNILVYIIKVIKFILQQTLKGFGGFKYGKENQKVQEVKHVTNLERL